MTEWKGPKKLPLTDTLCLEGQTPFPGFLWSLIVMSMPFTMQSNPPQYREVSSSPVKGKVLTALQKQQLPSYPFQ